MLPQGFQEVVILHVACADLNDIHIVKQRKLGNFHDFHDGGQSRCGLGQRDESQGFFPLALKGVGRSARLERAATQQGGTATLHRFRDGIELRLAFHRTRPGDQGKFTTTNPGTRKGNHRIQRVQFAIDLFVGLLNAFDIGNHIKRSDQRRIQRGRITYQAEQAS